jgi:hypothetical protein
MKLEVNPNAKPYSLNTQRAALLAFRDKVDKAVAEIDARLAGHTALIERLSALKAAGKLGVARDSTPYPMPSMSEKSKKHFKYLYDARMKRQQARDRKAAGG